MYTTSSSGQEKGFGWHDWLVVHCMCKLSFLCSSTTSSSFLMDPMLTMVRLDPASLQLKQGSNTWKQPSDTAETRVFVDYHLCRNMLLSQVATCTALLLLSSHCACRLWRASSSISSISEWWRRRDMWDWIIRYGRGWEIRLDCHYRCYVVYPCFACIAHLTGYQGFPQALAICLDDGEEDEHGIRWLVIALDEKIEWIAGNEITILFGYLYIEFK